MPKFERHKTAKPGIYYIVGSDPRDRRKEDRIYYGRWETKDKQTGKRICYDEKLGRASEGMTPPKAATVRKKYMDGRLDTRKAINERKKVEAAEHQKRLDAYSIDKLWTHYRKNRKKGKGLDSDKSRYNLYLKDEFGDMLPEEITTKQVTDFRNDLLKSKSPQTVKHVLSLLTWIVNHGFKNSLCQKLKIYIDKPEVDNSRVDMIEDEQLTKLMKVLKEHSHPLAPDIVRLALYSGLRKSEMFGLQWDDIDWENEFIHLPKTKSGKQKRIPLNEPTRKLLKRIEKDHSRRTYVHHKSPYVFPGKNGGKLVDINKALRDIKNKAGLPKSWRMLHSMRHQYATMMASTGEVTLHELSKLLTHSSVKVTERYAHLTDSALKRASNVANNIFPGEVE
jgi:integrase